MIDVVDAIHVHVVGRKVLDVLPIQDALGLQDRVICHDATNQKTFISTQMARTDELRATPEERQELIVIEPPDAVRPGRLEPIDSLKLAHQEDIAIKDEENESARVRLDESANLFEAAEPRDKVELVPRPIVDSVAMTKAMHQVRIDLDGLTLCKEWNKTGQ